MAYKVDWFNSQEWMVCSWHEVNIVTWIEFPEQWIKVNTDGSALTNLGKLGAEGILRDKDGTMLMAFTKQLGEWTNNKAEIQEAIFGITLALELCYKNSLLELDSQLVVYWIKQKVAPQWSIIKQLGRMQNVINPMQKFKSIHVFREANWVADTLSKHYHNTTIPQVYLSSNHLHKEANAY